MYAGGRADETARWYARLWTRIFRTGLLPRRWVVLEVTGRRSGQTRSFPLGMADVDGRWYLVSMLGECNWVANVRAAGGQVVVRRHRRRAARLAEVPVAERAAILRRYVEKVPGARPHVPVARNATLAEFAAVADRYPVFEVVER
jgi:deazaflavin-dependent oxidoreductase (nitroreductase family)